MKAARQNQKSFYYVKLIVLGATGRKMKSWKPLETGLLHPQISEGGIHKGNLEQSLKKKKGCNLLDNRQDLKKTRSVTLTEMPFRVTNMTFFVSQ